MPAQPYKTPPAIITNPYQSALLDILNDKDSGTLEEFLRNQGNLPWGDTCPNWTLTHFFIYLAIQEKKNEMLLAYLDGHGEEQMPYPGPIIMASEVTPPMLYNANAHIPHFPSHQHNKEKKIDYAISTAKIRRNWETLKQLLDRYPEHSSWCMHAKMYLDISINTLENFEERYHNPLLLLSILLIPLAVMATVHALTGNNDTTNLSPSSLSIWDKNDHGEMQLPDTLYKMCFACEK